MFNTSQKLENLNEIVVGGTVRFAIPSQMLFEEHVAIVEKIVSRRRGRVIYLRTQGAIANRDNHVTDLWGFREGIDQGFVVPD